MATMTNLEVSANLWRDRAGNTYHRVYVSVDGAQNQLVSPVTYGYGCQYLNTAGELLKQAGLSQSEDPYKVVRALKDAGVQVTEGWQRVRRKRDL
jgi:hypothetical protein